MLKWQLGPPFKAKMPNQAQASHVSHPILLKQSFVSQSAHRLTLQSDSAQSISRAEAARLMAEFTARDEMFGDVVGSGGEESDEDDGSEVPAAEGSSVQAIAEMIKSGKGKCDHPDSKRENMRVSIGSQPCPIVLASRIIIASGAGMSTSANIPDFRSPGGIYERVFSRFQLSEPEAIFDLRYFRRKPEPFFELCQDLFPGKHLPTLAHYFLVLLHRKKKLLRVFTQNSK